ncbi:uncharacterized protein LOC144704578 [Wolffia australiana]
MGIVKITRHEETFSEESDADLDTADVGCELIKITDQIFSVPYDLYELPDLKEVLSLETWNTCLNEEEKFSLTAYLPSVDQETFSTTMRELLKGENLFFGSPLEVFFQGLKGGLYSPGVSQFREALRFMQRCRYYHSLRSYHEKMGQKFSSMRMAWRDCPSDAGTEERVQIWINPSRSKPISYVDLNSLPIEEEDCQRVEKAVAKGVLKMRSKAIFFEPVGRRPPQRRHVLSRLKMGCGSFSGESIQEMSENCRESGHLKLLLTRRKMKEKFLGEEKGHFPQNWEKKTLEDRSRENGENAAPLNCRRKGFLKRSKIHYSQTRDLEFKGLTSSENFSVP